MGGFEGTAIEFKGLEAAKNEVFSWLPKSAGGTINILLLVSSLGWGLGILVSRIFYPDLWLSEALKK